MFVLTRSQSQHSPREDSDQKRQRSKRKELTRINEEANNR